MNHARIATWMTIVAGIAWLGAGCASKSYDLPPARVALPATSPAEVERALPGRWTIDVDASAAALARAQFLPRSTTVLRQEGTGTVTSEHAMVADRFDPKAYRETQRYWLDLLRQPDMQWELTFHADGTGEHRAIVQTGQAPVDTLFQWKLDGWRLHVEYPTNAHFRSFDVEMPSAEELQYPMQPLGDHLVLRHR
jgi:hypothetical protein